MSSNNTRPREWPQRLSAFLASKERAAFAWGVNDCCLFVADWVKALHEFDPADGLRGSYDSALSAQRILDERGGVGGIVSAAAAEHGWQEVSPKRASRGDLVTHEGARGTTAGVCCGIESAFPGEKGTVYFPTLDCARAWRI